MHGDSCDVRGRRSLYPAITGVNGTQPKSARGSLPGLRFRHIRLLVCLLNARRDRREHRGKIGACVPRADDGQNGRFCGQNRHPGRSLTTGYDRSPEFVTSGR
jgi:hypothetical protein